MTPRYRWIRWALGLLVAGVCCVGHAQAPEDDFEERPVVDGAAMPEDLLQRLRMHQLPTAIRAPKIPPTKVVLPETVAPPDDRQADRVGVPAPATMPIGYVGEVPQGIFERAPWHTQPDGGRIKRIELHSRSATALRVIMTDLGPLELRVYDPVTMSAFGPYTAPILNEDGTWWSTIIFGDTIGLEFYLPPGYTTPPKTLPRIVGAFYCYADFYGSDFYPQSGDCHTDLTCYPAWANSIEGRAIGRLTGTTACTGALINRTGSDFCPIMLTARHCIQTQDQANGVVVIWFYESQTCNGKNPPNLNTLPRNDGALLLKTDSSSEWTLMGLYAPPGSGNFVGWDSNYWANGGTATSINHPALLPKRIQFGTKTADSNCLGAASFYTNWGTFRTSAGASGSPVYDASRRVRGTMSCATDTNGDGSGGPCATDGWYGRLDIGYPELRWYIFEMANPTFVNRAVAGDPGNDGSSERGTSANPFNTVYEGTFCVPSNGTVRIVPGNYNERFRVWRPMRLERSGTSGVVRIGAP